MHVLLTGVSSFTGTWFALKLREREHRVTATLRGRRSDYKGLRGQRIELAGNAGVDLLEGSAFGDDRFVEAIEGMTVLCHHAAEVTDYHSDEFAVVEAVAANTAGAARVMARCRETGVSAVVATGSVFEQGEGLGEDPMEAFSPYGLSKGLSWQILRYWARKYDVPVGKFVIPNPFGPYEEARFCAHLMRTWAKGETAGVRTPDYIRDNIPVDLLAIAYVHFVEGSAAGAATARCGPAGYVEPQGVFAQRFAREVGGRLGLEAALDLPLQSDFAEPRMRTNADFRRYAWDETAFWDQAADYYGRTYLVR